MSDIRVFRRKFERSAETAAIPEPRKEDMYETVRALRETVLSLTRQRGMTDLSAVTVKDLHNLDLTTLVDLSSFTQWITGSGAPASTLGEDGDFYIDTATGSVYGPKTNGAWTLLKTRVVQAVVFDFGADVTTGDGKYYIHITEELDGMNLIGVHAEVINAGTTGTLDIQIHNVDNALDMLSTKLTIDSGETGSDTAATPAVINTSNDHVNTNDVVRIDIDAAPTTAPKGLITTLRFE